MHKLVLQVLLFSIVVVMVGIPLSSTLASAAEVIVFDEYTTATQLEEGKLVIKRNMTLRNVGVNPIIPGEIHFKIFEQRGDSKRGVPVDNFVAHTQAGDELETRLLLTDQMTDLVLHIWSPLLPGFATFIETEYEIEFSPKGILFYEVKLPVEQTTIPIKASKSSFTIPGTLFVTYAPEMEIAKAGASKVVSWEGKKNIAVIEYSRVPMPRFGMRAVNIFWISIIVLLILIFIISVVKGRSKVEGV